MSSPSPTSLVTRNKVNLSVASLINNTSNNGKLLAAEKQIKQPVVCACTLDAATKDTISMTSTTTRSLPTVAYSELLYKTISSHVSSTCSIPPLALARPTVAGTIYTYGVQNFNNKNISTDYTTKTSPLSHMKSLTQSVSMNNTKLNVSQVTPMPNNSYIHIKPTPSILTSRTLSTISGDAPSGKQIEIRHQSAPISAFQKLNVVASTGKVSSNLSVTSKIVGLSVPATSKVNNFHQITAETLKNNDSNQLKSILPAILVPRGWNRILEKDGITYVSPNKSRIRFHEDLVRYLVSDSTCKCGLECPLKPDEVFSFNPKVPSKFGVSTHADPSHVTICGVCKRFEEICSPTNKIKKDRPGKRRGKIKRRSSEDDRPAPDRKKILLTGASPLEMFQTGMDVLNASSVNPFKTLVQTGINEIPLSSMLTNSKNVDISKMRSKSMGSPPPMSKLRTNSDTAALIGNLSVPISTTSLHTSTAKSQENFALEPTCANSQSTSVFSKLNASPASSFLIKSEPVDMPFPKSLMGVKKRSRKTSGRGRGRGNTLKSPEELTLSKKKAVKKVLPDAAIKKASELQLNGYMQQAGYLLKQNSTQHKNADTIPSLKTIQSTPVFVSNQQVMAAQALLSGAGKTPEEVKEIYLQAAMLNQQIRASAYGKMALVSSTDSTVAIDGRNEVRIPVGNTTPPPNRTISSMNQLPEALRNQFTNINQNLSLQSSSPSHASSVACSLPREEQSRVQGSTAETAIASTAASNVSTGTLSHPFTATGITNQQVNRPLPSVSLSTTQFSTNSSQTQPTVSGQQMVLVQFVTQSKTTSNATIAKVNPPIVRAYSVPHPPAYVHAEGPNKFLVMNKGNASQALQSLAMQKAPNVQQNASVQLDSSKRTLQIQGLIPMHTHQSQRLPHPQRPPQGVAVVTSVPVQYVNKSGYPIAKQLDSSYPVMQYPPRPMSYVYPATTAMLRPSILNKTGNFIRIAPAVSPSNTSKTQSLEQEKLKKEQELLESMQEQLRRDSVVSRVSPAALSGALSFITSVALATSNATTTITAVPSKTPVSKFHDVTTGSVATIANKSTNVSSNSPDESSSSTPVCVPSQEKNSPDESSSTPVCVSSQEKNSSFLHTQASFIISSCGLSNNSSSSNSSTLSSHSSLPERELHKSCLLSDEVTLRCDENSSELLTSSDESKQHSPKVVQDSVKPIERSERRKSESFKEGDLVWVEITGYPSWPGRIINYTDDGKNVLHVSWFGSNQIHAVDNSQLKSFDEGFKELDGNPTKRGYRANRKQLNDLEKAIAEALEELERRQTDLSS